jgi:hypothetical protein
MDKKLLAAGVPHWCLIYRIELLADGKYEIVDEHGTSVDGPYVRRIDAVHARWELLDALPPDTLREGTEPVSQRSAKHAGWF